MSNIFKILSTAVMFLGLSACDRSQDILCPEIDVQVLGPVRVNRDYLLGPMISGQGPGAAALGIILKLPESSSESDLVRISLWPRLSHQVSGNDLSCRAGLLLGQKVMSCVAAIENKNLILSAQYYWPKSGDVTAAMYEAKTMKLSGEISTRALSCK
jgi:hypothetical protein